MISNFDLLDVVLPKEGRYCALGIGPYIHQKLVDTREEFDEQVKWLVDNKFNAYFGCAKYGDANHRKHDNAHFFRALWMDIDCGEDKAEPDENGKVKGYATQELGLAAVRQFCVDKGLPRPVMVDSGYGLHFYWILTETLRRNVWESLSKRLRDVAVEHGLIVDASVFEASRVLRIPGTYNFKDAQNPKQVSVIGSTYEAKSYEFWKELLGASEPEADRSFIPRRLSPLMESLYENRVKRFKTIMMKTAEGKGCRQLQHCYENQESIEYNLWRSALSIATHCEDREWAIHFISNNHPDYRPGDTEAKAADIGGPHHCTTFEKANPDGCVECPNYGKFKSPIMLGVVVAQAEDYDDGDGEDAGEADSGSNLLPLEAPIPEPYFRAKTGAIFLNVADSEPVLIYENTLYVVKRMKDPVTGETALLHLHLPKDGLKEFTVPLASIVVKERLREELAKQGVAAGDAQIKNLLYYLITAVKNLQITEKAETMRTQFGWVEKDSKLIIGDREITKDGTFYSPPSTFTASVAEQMKPMGSLEKWKEVFNLYARPGMEANAFAALTGFGSLLLKFTGISGAIINLIYPRSGSGKSTTLYVCNSISGHPRNLTSIWKDTFNSKMHRLGVMNNLANTIDEITNTTAQEFSDLAYSISQGRGKNRMKSSSNEERVNLTSWQGITLTSSNASFYEKLGLAKDSPDGESMRLFEYEIAPSDVISMAEGKEMFDHQLLDNYGHAIQIFGEWLVNNQEEAIATLRQVQAKIDSEVQFTSRERFWSAIAACNITGGLIAKRIDLHEYNMKAIYEWLKQMLQKMRQEVTPPASDTTQLLGEFINAHMSNAVVVDGIVDSRTKLDAAPILEPRGELYMRYEPDTKRLFITASSIRRWCAERQVSYKTMMAQLTEKEILVGLINKRMAKGMKINAPAVRALELDASQHEFIRMDEFTSSDENRTDTVHD
jgi:hypothetical protein